MNTYHIMNKYGIMESRTIHEGMNLNDPMDLILLIAQRYESICNELNIEPDARWTTMMDMEKAAQSLELDVDALRRLWEFDNSDFIHDIGGIKRHIDRLTGEIGGCFLPRCS